MATISSKGDAGRTTDQANNDDAPAELAARLRMAIARLARALRRQSHSGLTPSQQGILATINDRGPLTPSQLANQEQVSAPSISRAVARLEADGLIQRHPDEQDRRSIQLSLTDAGHARLGMARSRRNVWLASRLAELDADQRSRLADAIEVLELLTAPPNLNGPTPKDLPDESGEA
jgi:DNA-binding MarR family transcriptional regulator